MKPALIDHFKEQYKLVPHSRFSNIDGSEVYSSGLHSKLIYTLCHVTAVKVVALGLCQVRERPLCSTILGLLLNGLKKIVA